MGARDAALGRLRVANAAPDHRREDLFAEALLERFQGLARVDQPHVRETGLIQWLSQAGLNQAVPVPALPGMLPQAEGTPRGTAPVTGQHTTEVLAAHGFAAAEIDALLAQGTVASAA